MDKLDRTHIMLIISTIACVILTIFVAAFTSNKNLIRICLLVDFIMFAAFFIVHDMWERKQKKEHLMAERRKKLYYYEKKHFKKNNEN